MDVGGLVVVPTLLEPMLLCSSHVPGCPVPASSEGRTLKSGFTGEVGEVTPSCSVRTGLLATTCTTLPGILRTKCVTLRLLFNHLFDPALVHASRFLPRAAYEIFALDRRQRVTKTDLHSPQAPGPEPVARFEELDGHWHTGTLARLGTLAFSK